MTTQIGPIDGLPGWLVELALCTGLKAGAYITITDSEITLLPPEGAGNPDEWLDLADGPRQTAPAPDPTAAFEEFLRDRDKVAEQVAASARSGEPSDELTEQDHADLEWLGGGSWAAPSPAHSSSETAEVEATAPADDETLPATDLTPHLRTVDDLVAESLEMLVTEGPHPSEAETPTAAPDESPTPPVKARKAATGPRRRPTPPADRVVVDELLGLPASRSQRMAARRKRLAKRDKSDS